MTWHSHTQDEVGSRGNGGQIAPAPEIAAARTRQCFFLPKGAAGAATQIVS